MTKLHQLMTKLHPSVRLGQPMPQMHQVATKMFWSASRLDPYAAKHRHLATEDFVLKRVHS
jgi:hypothetical protein